jgi:putative ABC transport system permease protein
MQEFKTALRSLARRLGFSLWVIAIFAAGIAANTAVFGIFDGLFLRAFPFPKPAQLLYINESAPSRNMAEVRVSYDDLESWSAGTGAFESIAGFKDGDGDYLYDGREAIRAKFASVTYNFAATLGVKPILGRDFFSEEDRKGMGRVVLLKYDFWQRRFAGQADVIGKIVQLDNTPFTIIGVLPRTAVFPGSVDLWMPLGAYISGTQFKLYSGVGRLKTGFTVDQARADLMRIHKGLISTRPSNAVTQPEVMPLRERYLGDYRLMARVIFGAVIFVLLIACVNIAGLTLARGTARSRELAIRQALGASPRRLVGQLLTESLLLAVAGGAVGVALSWVILRAALSMMPDLLPSWVDFSLDSRIVIFAVLATGVAGLLAGLSPALQVSKVSFLADAVPKVSLSSRRRRAMNTLVVAEVAVAVVLLAAGGLVLKAFRKVLTTDPGFRTGNVLTFALDIPYGNPPDTGRIMRFYAALLPQLRVLPGVDSVGGVGLYGLPMNGFNFKFGFIAEGMSRSPGPNPPAPTVVQRQITPGYFQAMGMELRAGREFEERDSTDQGMDAVIVSEAFAKSFWPGEPNVIGKRVGRGGRNPDWMTVVGVARDMHDDGLDQEARPVAYLPYREGAPGHMSIAIHRAGNAGSQLTAAQEIIRRLDPSVTLFDVHTMQEIVDRSLWLRRAYSWLFGVFAGFGLVLSLAGVYGVISYTVTQRTREIGIRMALGAEPRQVLAQVLREGMLLVGTGVAIGFSVAIFATRFLESMLAGVSTRDPWALAIAIVLLSAAALAANAVPARRAAAVNPVDALRFEG